MMILVPARFFPGEKIKATAAGAGTCRCASCSVRTKILAVPHSDLQSCKKESSTVRQGKVELDFLHLQIFLKDIETSY